ncbi:hypothetical protein GCM10009733_063780 [Nonomuraea maheshkhaliensis]|uniref:ABC transporter domain-containing protein n=1 Tax=Nonomuraea maheshkhaliensis TaxID=419590 RepID=A0ABP4RQ18_9ACTN
MATDEEAPAPPRTSFARDRSVLAPKGVTFAYPGAETPLLRDPDLHIRPGERLAVAGRNGAGKTTLAKLLTGLYTPTTGTATTPTTAAAVFQDFIRYPLPLRDNVRLGPDRTDGGPDRRARRRPDRPAGHPRRPRHPPRPVRGPAHHPTRRVHLSSATTPPETGGDRRDSRPSTHERTAERVTGRDAQASSSMPISRKVPSP